MAEKSTTTSKLKLVLSDESSEDDEKVSKDDDLGLSLDKLNLGPQKKLLILCLGGLLVHRVHVRDKATVKGLRPDVVYGKFLVFKRPFCTEFLQFCFERFEVGLWSSARDHNIDGVLSNITGGMRSKLLFVWSQEECTDSGFCCLSKKEKPLFLKELKDLWKNKYYNKGGRFSAKNTLLIDDEPHIALLNPPNTAIFPTPYKKHDKNDTLLGPEGELRKYLEGVAEAEDVPSYVKDHPIGQPAITVSHPNWSYYEKIVRHFAKRNEREGAETSAI
ncbi:Phosphoprotein phosphatase [Handroanthus impetiginosus]|uniref:Mitochondrial import inner membrane translocase subunit TIM50 n=1 Tax=Handroanthus impetiginosus TaxID=429701 RepID=A0A2G9GP70_9LAMI|nr:Phosphoprotein phosphatase [Handroanthus impetiginosus]